MKATVMMLPFHRAGVECTQDRRLSKGSDQRWPVEVAFGLGFTMTERIPMAGAGSFGHNGAAASLFVQPAGFHSGHRQAISSRSLFS